MYQKFSWTKNTVLYFLSSISDAHTLNKALVSRDSKLYSTFLLFSSWKKKSYFMYELTLIIENFKVETITQQKLVIKKK